MALSLALRKQNSKAFDLVLHEERLRSASQLHEEDRAQQAVAAAQERFGNLRLASALDLSPAPLAGLSIDESPLAGNAGFLHDQLSLALAGFDTGLLGPHASNAAVQDAMATTSGLESPGAAGAGAGQSALRRGATADSVAEEEGLDLQHPAVRGMHSRAGSPLPSAVAARLGAAFGHDFSHVRVHTDAAAAAAAEALNARAFAIGTEIWFGRGAFNPGSPEGDRILAHELTHVQQADEGRLPSPSGPGLDVSSPTDAAEQEAYANERSIVASLDGPSTEAGALADQAFAPSSALDSAPVGESSGGGSEASAAEGTAHRDFLGKRSGKSRPDTAPRPGGGIPIPEVKGRLGGVNIDVNLQVPAGLPGGTGEERSPRQMLDGAIRAVPGLAGHKPADMDVTDRNGQRPTSLIGGDGTGVGVTIRGAGNSGVRLEGHAGGNGGHAGVNLAANVGTGQNTVGLNLNANGSGVSGNLAANVGGNQINLDGSAGAGGNRLSGNATVGAGGNQLNLQGNLGEGGNRLSGNARVGAGGNQLNLQGNLGEGGNSLSANGSLGAGGNQLGVDAAFDANGVKADLDAQVGGQDGLKVDVKADADGVKADVKLGADGKPIKEGKEKGEKEDPAAKEAKKEAREREGEGKEGEGEDGEGKEGPGEGKGGPGAKGDGKGAGGGPGAKGEGGAGPGGRGGRGGGPGGLAAGQGGPGQGPTAGGAQGPRELARLSLPRFDLKKEQADKLKKKTGRSPEQHQQAIQEHVDRIKVQVDTFREGLRVYAEQHALSLETEIKTARDTLTADISGAKGRVSGAYASARDGLGAAAAEALGTVSSAADTARTALAASLPQQQARLAAAVQAGKTSVEALGPTWKDKFWKALDEGAKAFEKTGGDLATELAGTKESIVNSWKDEGDALLRAENEARRKAASKGVDDAVADFRSGGMTKGAAARGQRATYDQQIDAALLALSQAFDQMGRDGATALQTAHDTAVAQIATQSTEATTAIGAAQTNAGSALTTAEAAAQSELDATQARNETSLSETAATAKASISETDLQLRERYAQWFDGVLAGLPKDQATTYDAVKEYLDGKERELPGFNSGIMTQLDTACESARTMVQGAVQNARSSLTNLADSSCRQAAEQGTAQANGIRQTGTQFAASITQTSSAVETAFTQHVAPMAGNIQQRMALTEQQMTAGLQQAKDQLVAQNTQYQTQLRQRITQMPQTLSPMANAAAAGLYAQLSDRAQRIHTACKGMGTDESGVYNALRGLTALSGAALESVVWPRLFAAEGSLRSFLIDDLNDSEQAIAFAYLGGNTAVGARLELDACIHWYGDDEAQIEKILRELSPEDLAAMKNDPGWAATRQRLMDNLGGTDLDVTRALIAGNAARADAYRLRDQIDEARRSGDPDALHKALEGVDPANLAAVQQEFHNIQNRVDPEATNVPPIDPQRAAQELGDWVTRDIPTIDPNTGEQTSLQITGANRDLARSLAMQGRDSVDAAASRFEVERGRSGGPNMENMEKALMAPRDLQDRLHSPDPQVRQQAEQERDQRANAVRQRYTEQYGGPERRSMDQAIDGMMQDSNPREGEVSRRMMHNMLSDGTNSPRVAADMVWLGREGWGTNEAQIKRALGGMRPDEVQAMATEYQAQHGRSVYADLGVVERDANGNRVPGRDHSGFGSELSGDDRREVEQLLMGDPRYMNNQQRLALSNLQYDWQRGEESTRVGRWMMDGSAEQRDLDRNHANLQNLSQRMRPDGTFTNPEDQREYERLCGDMGINAQQYQAASDRTANYITTGVAIVGAVVVTAATFGSGAPAGAAMIIAATGTAASGAISMGVNYSMKGGRYGWEQAVTDAGMTAVQTATAGLGAGMSAANGGAGIFANSMGKLGSQATSAGMMGFVNGAAQVATTDGTWDRGLAHGLGEVGLGGIKQGAMDALSSGVSNYMEDSAIGTRLQNSGFWGNAAIKGTSNAVGGMSSTALGLGFDAARGKYHGDLAGIAETVGTEGAKQFVIGAGGGIAGHGAKSYFDSRNPTRAPTGSPQPGPGNDGNPPPPGAGQVDGPNNTPPNSGGGNAQRATESGTPRTNPNDATTQTGQRPVGSNDAGETRATPSTPRTDSNIDPNTGRPIAGTQADASTIAQRPQPEGGGTGGGKTNSDAEIVTRPNGEKVVISADRVVTASDEGVVSINRDGTKDVVDARGNRTMIDTDGTQRTILPDGTVVVRNTDGTAIAARDGQTTPLDQNGRPIQPDNQPTRQTDQQREAAAWSRADELVRGGKMTYDEAFRVLGAGDVNAVENALKAAEARIGRDDAVMNRLVELHNQVDVNGQRAISSADADAVIDAPDMQQALKVLESRVQNRQADTAVRQAVDSQTKTDPQGGAFVDTVYDNITVGAGFAGISNELSARSNGATGERLVVGGENPWMKAQADLGQRAGESEVPGGSRSMTRTADSADAPFMKARQHAENVEINRAEAGVGVLRSQIDGVELRSQMPEGGTWHKDAPARIRVIDGYNPDGSPKFRYIYAQHVDVATGAGPSRELSTKPGHDGTPAQIDPDLYAQLRREGRILQSDQGFDGRRIQEGEKVLVYGAGASGAWGVEGSYRNAGEVEWLGRMARPSHDMPPTQRARLEEIYSRLEATTRSGDAQGKEAAMRDLERFTFTEGRGNGFLPRNQRPGAAFDPAMQVDAPGGKITRSVTDDIKGVTYQTNPETGRMQIRMEGKDGQVFWADRVVLAIGQDGDMPGGPGHILGTIRDMNPLIDTSGREFPFPVVVGVQSDDGAVRVVGAAATSPAVRRRIQSGFRDSVDENFSAQATHSSVPTDSNGVVGSFHHAERMIRAANRDTLVDLATATPQEQQRILGLHQAEVDAKMARDNERLRQRPPLPGEQAGARPTGSGSEQATDAGGTGTGTGPRSSETGGTGPRTSQGDGGTTSGSVDSTRSTDVLRMNHSQFENDVVAQRTLFDSAGAAVDRMRAAGHEIAADLPGTEVSSLRKRDDFDGFVSEVMKKQRTKNYGEMGEMSDIVRGRFNVTSAEDMAAVAQRLQERFGADVVEVKPPRDGYPRWHINVRDADTGLVHEWQVGTKATTDFFERKSLTIPESITQFTGRPDFHDGVYKLLNKVSDPALRARYGIDEMMVGYKQLTEETGAVSRGQPEPQNYRQRYDELAQTISGKLARIEADHPGYFDRLLSGGSSKTAGASSVTTPDGGVGGAQLTQPKADVVDANAPRAADSGSRAQDNNTPGTQRSTADSNATQDSNVTRPPGTVDSQKPADVLTMHHSEWANDPVAQRTLFEAAGAAVERMKQVARTVAGDLPGAEVSSLRKRDSLDSFVEKVLEKQRSKGYGSISDMSDIIRGRFNLDSAADMDTVAARLKEAFKGDIVEIKPPRDGYPRWHINVRDAETGLVHEWQVGTKATTDFFERESLSIPKTIQNFDGRPNFHDGVYKLLNKIKDPAVRAAYGLDDMMVGYKQLTEETGRVTREQSFPTDYEKRYQAMADQISATIARIEAERPGYLDSVLAGGGGGH